MHPGASLANVFERFRNQVQFVDSGTSKMYEVKLNWYEYSKIIECSICVYVYLMPNQARDSSLIIAITTVKYSMSHMIKEARLWLSHAIKMQHCSTV